MPDQIKFIHGQDFLNIYPDLSPQESVNKITREFGAVFIIGIGAKLSDGKPHDIRAPDYDYLTTFMRDY